MMAPAKETRLCLPDSETVIPSKRLPSAFWFIIKILWLLQHETVVQERKCFKCSVRKLNSDRGGRTVINERRRVSSKRGSVEVVDSVLLSYHSDDHEHILNEEMTPILLSMPLNQESGDCCEVCDSLWWDYHGQVIRYTDSDIGEYRSNINYKPNMSTSSCPYFRNALFFHLWKVRTILANELLLKGRWTESQRSSGYQ